MSEFFYFRCSARAAIATLDQDAQSRDREIESLTDQVVTLVADETLAQTELDTLAEVHAALQSAHEQLEAHSAEQASQIGALQEENEADKVSRRTPMQRDPSLFVSSFGSSRAASDAWGGAGAACRARVRGRATAWRA